MELKRPYLLFLGDVPDQLAAKTAQGVVDWQPDWCLGQLRLPGCQADCRLPDMTTAQAVAKGAKTFVIGAVNAGGVLPEHWVKEIVAALHADMDVVSGLHQKLESFPAIATAAEQTGKQLYNLRYNTQKFATGKGTKRSGKRLLMVGTDCSVGKKYAALSLARDMAKCGMNVDFRATGQTGVLISGRGIALDAVIADFISGAVEWLSPDNAPDHWDVIEGQGSLFHPSFASVSLGLLHGSQPDAIVVCHEPSRTKMRGVDYPLPSIAQTIERNLLEGTLTNPDIQCIGICINTSTLDDKQADKLLNELATKHNIPCCDPIRTGTQDLINELQRRFP